MSAAHLGHLARRFVTSLWPAGPPREDDSWARRQLNAGETEIWSRMSRPDRRHAVGVARQVDARLQPDGPEVLAAALLHDSGKVASGLGTLSRVGATVFWAVVDNERAHRWSDRRGPIGRLARYRLHPELGADMLTEAGSHQLVVAWAREHHLPPEAWTVPTSVATVLKACDDD